MASGFLAIGMAIVDQSRRSMTVIALAIKTQPPQSANGCLHHGATGSQLHQPDVSPGSSDPGRACNTSEKYLRDTVGAGACVSHFDVLSAEHLFSSDDGGPRVERENG